MYLMWTNCVISCVYSLCRAGVLVMKNRLKRPCVARLHPSSRSVTLNWTCNISPSIPLSRKKYVCSTVVASVRMFEKSWRRSCPGADGRKWRMKSSHLSAICERVLGRSGVSHIHICRYMRMQKMYVRLGTVDSRLWIDRHEPNGYNSILGVNYRGSRQRLKMDVWLGVVTSNVL